MDHTLKFLTKCALFNGFSDKDIYNIFQNTTYIISSFPKNQVIAMEGEDCSNLGIIVKGSVEAKKLFASGRAITITSMRAGDIFGEAIIFSYDPKIPSTIISTGHTKVVFISKTGVIELCSSNPQFLNNFMGLLSNKVLILAEKIRNLSYRTIRQKISRFIIDEYRKQNDLTLTIPFSRKEMAEQLGVPRPSLSREMINLKREGIIDFSKNIVKIIKLDILENIILLG